MKRRVAEVIADFWADNGIRDVFMVTGGGAMHLDDALGRESRLRCICNHHEQACAMAAEAYARLTGNLAGVCVTSGPGGTNAATGVYGAWVDSIPMFVLSGQVKRATTVWSTGLPLRQLGDQEFYITEMVRCMTKYAVMVTEPNDVLYHLQKAMFLCKNGRPGPVWLDVPLDVQAAMVEEGDLRAYDPAEDAAENPPKPSADVVKQIIEKVRGAKRPVLYTGTGIRISGGHEDFIALADRLNIPIVTEWNGHDVLWNDHRLYCGRPGLMGLRGGNFVVQNSDLVLSLGSRLSIRQVGYTWEEFAKHAYKIMVDIDEAELKKPTLKIDMPIHANVKDVMVQLNEALDKPLDVPAHREWLDWCRKIDAKYPAVLPKFYEKQSPINPYVFIDKLFHLLPEGQNVAAANGSACVVTFQTAHIKKGQRLFHNSGCASMGYGLPAAIGAYFATDGEPIVCLEGDGSIQMNLQELQTVVHHDMDIKIIWLNNDGYHSIRQTQTNIFGGELVGVSPKSGVSFPSAESIATAYGVRYVRVDHADAVDEVLRGALAARGPIIIEAVLDHEQFFEPKISSKVLPDGSIVSPPMQDMYPFLSREEYGEGMLVDYE